MRANATAGGVRGALLLGALGVVFGDIGTSPIYTLQTVFDPGDPHPVPVSPDSVLGIVSLIVWSVTLVITVTYVTLVMRADNDGEGGIMALITLLRRKHMTGGRRTKALMASLGIFGASLFLGDSVITPAISVLSSVEGLEVASPSLEHLVVPITAAIIVALFLLQRVGTAAVGRLFGPVMLGWFIVIGACGVRGIASHPEILEALSPTYALSYLVGHFSTAFFALAAVVLAVTGAEAIYADMGHFGRTPIRLAWLLVVFPACALSYLGQGALILEDERNISSPFFLLFPDWAQIPMVLLATVATVIASQAVISGAFSVTRQAVQLGFLPRLTVLHTSHHEVGQVYVPAVNWGIFVAVVALVLGFGSSAGLASAYGIAVTGTLAIDTVLFFVVVRTLWGKPWWLVGLGAAAFLTVDLTFFGANLPKVVHGGWFPLLIALIVFVVLTTWQRGREIVTENRTKEEGPLRDFVEEVHALEPPAYRPPLTGVFLNANIKTTPLALRANFEHNRSVHANVVIVSVQTERVPHVPEEDRVTLDDLGYRDDGITHVIARFGFQDTIDVPHMLRDACSRMENDVDLDHVSYFISRITIVPTDAPGMAVWRKKLFTAVARNAANPVPYFCLPDDRTIVMGSHIEL